MSDMTVTVNGSDAKAKNRLTSVQTMRLGQWLEQQKDTIDNRKINAKHAAELATTDLGFPVTFSNVGRMAAELNIPIDGGLAPAGESLVAKVGFLTECIVDLQKMIFAQGEKISILTDVCMTLSGKDYKKDKAKQTV